MSALVFSVVGAVGVGVLATDPGDPGGTASHPVSAAVPHTVSPAAAAALIDRLDRALVDGDVAAAEALAPSGDAAARAALAALVGNARALHLRDLSVRFLGLVDAGADAGADAGSAAGSAGGSVAGSVGVRVRLTWRIPRSDRRPARVDTTLGVRVVDARVALTDVRFGPKPQQNGPESRRLGPNRNVVDARTPVWWSGPVRVARREGVLVMVRRGAPGPRAAELARRAARAVAVVRRALPGWRGGLVVEVPRSAAALDAALGTPTGEHAAIAAVTATVDGSSGGRAPTHVFLNPGVFDRQRALAAQVVLAHEATHVATGAASSAPGAPPWLVEGFADYVALRDVRLPSSVLTGQLARLVRREGVPARLPGAAAFDARARHLGATYQSAWLACRLVAQRAGEPALVALYADVRAGVEPGRAFRRTTDLTLGTLTARWQRRLASLAGGAG